MGAAGVQLGDGVRRGVVVVVVALLLGLSACSDDESARADCHASPLGRDRAETTAAERREARAAVQRFVCLSPPPGADDERPLARPTEGQTKAYDPDTPGMVPVRTGPISKPHRLWKRLIPLAEPSIDPGWCPSCGPSVAVANGHVIAEDIERHVIMDLDLESGETRWTYRPNEGRTISYDATQDEILVSSTMKIGAGRDTRSEPFLTGLDPETGEPRWRSGDGGRMPVDGGQALIHPVGGRQELRLIPSGKRVMTFARDEKPIVGIRNVYVLRGSQFDAYDLETGKRRWRTDIPTDRSAPKWTTSDAFVSEYDSVVVFDVPPHQRLAYDVESGKQLWTDELTDDLGDGGVTGRFRERSTGMMPIGDDTALDFPYSEHGYHPSIPTVAIDLRTGRERWRTKATEWGELPSGMDGDDLLIVDDGVGQTLTVTRRDIRTGAVTDRGKVRSGFLALGQGMGYLHDTIDEKLIGYRLSDLERMWTLDLSGYRFYSFSDGVIVAWNDTEVAAYG